MNELLIVFFILLISAFMYFSIIYILKADKKVLELNEQVLKFKKTDFSQLKKAVSFFAIVNKYVKLGKIKQYFEITVTIISSINAVILLKKLYSKYCKDKI